MCIKFLASSQLIVAMVITIFPYIHNSKPLHFSKLKTKLYKKLLYTQNGFPILSNF